MLVPLLLLALAAPAQSTAPAQSRAAYVATLFGPDGSEFVEECRQAAKAQRQEQADDVAVQACFSFIAGVVDGGQFAAKGDRHLFPICFPPNVTGFQMAKIVVKYGDDHPEKLNNGGAYIVVNALRQAFPCSATPPA